MKKYILSFSLLLSFQLFSLAQGNYSKWNGKTWEQLDGNGKMVQLTPTVLPFNSIESNNIDVQLTVDTGVGESVHVSADENLKEFFRCTQEGSVIKLFMELSGGKHPRWLSTSHIVVTINAPAVKSLVNKGNNKVKINIQDEPSFSLFADGNPDISLTGRVTTLHLQTNGNGDINAGNLMAEKVFLTANGNSSISVNAKDVVEESLKGNNDIANLFYHPEKRADTSAKSTEMPAAELIRFRLKNNSLSSKKVSLIAYRPDEKGNSTNIFTLIPLGSKSFQFPEGTKIYLASDQQVNTVMSGAKISDQPPFLIVMKKDAGQMFSIK